MSGKIISRKNSTELYQIQRTLYFFKDHYEKFPEKAFEDNALLIASYVHTVKNILRILAFDCTSSNDTLIAFYKDVKKLRELDDVLYIPIGLDKILNRKFVLRKKACMINISKLNEQYNYP